MAAGQHAARLQALLGVGGEEGAGFVEADPVAQGGEHVGQAAAGGVVHQRRAGGDHRDAGTGGGRGDVPAAGCRRGRAGAGRPARRRREAPGQPVGVVGQLLRIAGHVAGGSSRARQPGRPASRSARVRW
jgi:hypothetical protein